MLGYGAGEFMPIKALAKTEKQGCVYMCVCVCMSACKLLMKPLCGLRLLTI